MDTVSTDQFTWNSSTRTFVAECSDFNGGGNPFPNSSVFEMVSSRTGERRVFVFNRSKHDGENDLLYLEYKCGDMTCKIFND